MSLQKLVVGPADSVECERSERARAQVRRVKAEYPGNRSNATEADRQVVAQASKRVGQVPLSEILAEVEQFGVNLEKLAIMLLDEGETLAKAACEFANSDVGRLARGTVLKLEMDFGDVLFEGLATMIQEGGMGARAGS